METARRDATMAPNTNPLLREGKNVKRRNPLHDIRVFVAAICVLVFMQMICHVYYVGVVRTLERRFGLQSKQTGFINSCNDIVTVFVVILVGYFGGRSHQPRVISVFSSIFAVGSLIFASPYFLFPRRSSFVVSADNGTLSRETPLLCDPFRPASLSVCRESDRQEEAANQAAYGVFIIAQLFVGFGGSASYVLGLSFIDENASKTKSPIYLGK